MNRGLKHMVRAHLRRYRRVAGVSPMNRGLKRLQIDDIPLVWVKKLQEFPR